MEKISVEILREIAARLTEQKPAVGKLGGDFYTAAESMGDAARVLERLAHAAEQRDKDIAAAATKFVQVSFAPCDRPDCEGCNPLSAGKPN